MGNEKRQAADIARSDNARRRKVCRREEQCADDSAIDLSAAVEFVPAAVREAGLAPASFATLLERVRAKERAAAAASEADP